MNALCYSIYLKHRDLLMIRIFIDVHIQSFYISSSWLPDIVMNLRHVLHNYKDVQEIFLSLQIPVLVVLCLLVVRRVVVQKQTMNLKVSIVIVLQGGEALIVIKVRLSNIYPSKRYIVCCFFDSILQKIKLWKIFCFSEIVNK